jgi:hypothetical protein
MATRKTTAERIADTKKTIEQYENQMKLLLQKQKEQERRERTHRLIERGAILESLIPGAESMSNQEIKVLLEAALPHNKATEAEQEALITTVQTVGNGTGKAG